MMITRNKARQQNRTFGQNLTNIVNNQNQSNNINLNINNQRETKAVKRKSYEVKIKLLNI